MPRYYFHILEPGRSERDNDGAECLDLAHAEQRAIRIARDIMVGNVMDGWLHLGSIVEVESEIGGVEARVLFSKAVVITH